MTPPNTYALPPLHRQFKDADGALIVYNIADYSSYEDAAVWLDDLRIHPNIILMLVGNQCDMEDHRAVPMHEAKAYAEKNSMMFFETSAKDGTNVEAAFHNLVTGQHCTHPSPLHNTVARQPTRPLLITLNTQW